MGRGGVWKGAKETQNVSIALERRQEYLAPSFGSLISQRETEVQGRQVEKAERDGGVDTSEHSEIFLGDN